MPVSKKKSATLLNRTPYLVEVTQEQKFTVSVEAEDVHHAIELANSQQGKCECELPPELLIKRTRIIE